MVLVYFVYGLSFFTLASVLSLQARSPIRILRGISVGMLCGFAFLHALAEWTKLAEILARQGNLNLSIRTIDLVDLLVTNLSFFLSSPFWNRGPDCHRRLVATNAAGRGWAYQWLAHLSVPRYRPKTIQFSVFRARDRISDALLDRSSGGDHRSFRPVENRSLLQSEI